MYSQDNFTFEIDIYGGAVYALGVIELDGIAHEFKIAAEGCCWHSGEVDGKKLPTLMQGVQTHKANGEVEYSEQPGHRNYIEGGAAAGESPAQGDPVSAEIVERILKYEQIANDAKKNEVDKTDLPDGELDFLDSDEPVEDGEDDFEEDTSADLVYTITNGVPTVVGSHPDDR